MFATRFISTMRRPLTIAKMREAQTFPATHSGEDITFSRVYTMREFLDGDLDREEIELKTMGKQKHPAYGHFNNLNDLVRQNKGQ